MTDSAVGDAATRGDLPETPLLATEILAGGGEMGAMMRAFDWARTPVGPMEDWPQSLRTALSIIADSRYPMYIVWGPEFTEFYNDAFVPILGTKHPRALGGDSRETWAEIWADFVGPLFAKVRDHGEATYLDDSLVSVDRNGYLEECYFTFCYSPIRGEAGAVGGILVTCIETTGRVVGERRLQTLRQLADTSSDARSPADACRNAATVLAANTHDLPFTAIYLLDESGSAGRLAGLTGLPTGHPAAPAAIDPRARSLGEWPVGADVMSGQVSVIDLPRERFGSLPGGPWPESPRQGAIVPVRRVGQDGQDGLDAVMVAGLSPRRAVDHEYRRFLELIAGHLARAMASARAHEEERRRSDILADLAREKTRLLDEAQRAHAELESKAEELQQAAVELEMQSEELRATTDTLQEVNQRLAESEHGLRDEAQVVETIQRVGGALASDLDLTSLVQTVTDEATKLTGAQFGAFFYNVLNASGESYMLYTISGVPRSAFDKFPMPRNTKVFEPTFRGTGVVRSDDITKDPRYGQNPPHYGKPKGHLPVVSYLAVPVVSRAGEVLGGLFFGHPAQGVFTERHERLAVGIAGWAAVAIDNARLYERERRARADAENARAEAEQANKAKTEFLATMSHELRTPLNAIAGYVDLLDLEVRGPVTELQRDDLRRIQRSQRHLLSLINDVLNFAKLEAGQVELNPTTVVVRVLLADIEQLVSPQFAAKGLTYTCTDCDSSLVIRADEEKTRQVLLNLLTNAVKFTPTGGQVSVQCVARDGLVEIRVTDTGRGIPGDKVETIFEPFVQVDRHLTPTGQQGVGLGLAISRDLARAMGGDIDVESVAGRGSTFIVTLPRFTS